MHVTERSDTDKVTCNMLLRTIMLLLNNAATILATGRVY